MAFVLRPDRDIGEELPKIARNELRRASAALGRSTALSQVHDARKRVKKVRAVVKLMREADEGEWSKSDKRLRAAGRLLSDLRDTDALVETVDQLRKRYPKRMPARLYRAIRRELTRQRADAMKAVSDKGHLKSAAKKLDRVRRAAKKWRLSVKRSELPALLRQSFQASRQAMKIAAKAEEPEAIHDWRKRVKTLWYHLRLIASLTSDLESRIGRLRSLERLLGDDHNLEVLCAAMADDEDVEQHRRADRSQVVAVARTRQTVVRRQAFALGQRLHAGTGRQFARALRLR